MSARVIAKRYLGTFCYLAIGAFVAGRLWHLLIAVLGWSWTHPMVLFPPYRMPLYHVEHLSVFLAAVALVFASFGTIWCRLARKRRRLVQLATLGMTLILTITIAGLLGGALWVVYDISAGGNAYGVRSIPMMIDGAVLGVEVGWYIVVLSFPYTPLCMASAIVLLLSARARFGAEPDGAYLSSSLAKGLLRKPPP